MMCVYIHNVSGDDCAVAVSDRLSIYWQVLTAVKIKKSKAIPVTDRGGL
jgi:hypothetical protein